MRLERVRGKRERKREMGGVGILKVLEGRVLGGGWGTNKPRGGGG